MTHIAIIGECMIELNGTPFGTMTQTYGGDSLNTAVYLARCADVNVAVKYVSALGVDAISDGMIERWQHEGVNTELVLRDTTRQPGLYLIQLDDRGERTFLYWRNQSAARYMLQHQDFAQVEATLAKVDMVYLSGISLAILPQQDRLRLIKLLSQLRKQGVEIAFDSNYRPVLWRDADEAREYYRQLLEITDLALVTNDDEHALWGDSDEKATLARLQAVGVKRAVVKMGAKGNLYQDFVEGSPKNIAATPVELVVDTTSAGDSFNAGFLAGYLQGKDAEQCSSQGHQLAGIVIQHQGAIIPQQATDAISFT
ncbi:MULTISPECIES: sugar kinase [Vibrio]|uniref:Sugar kinase n=1 Tax=Vibrio atlanticus TaxID=693153 RepID=A0ABV4KWU5_9VIBR|nr:sugar kinase [Vibrio crassostreae]TCT70308.1 2-keto-3-deoxygluconate kinase [Vibrio crassostreae]